MSGPTSAAAPTADAPRDPEVVPDVHSYEVLRLTIGFVAIVMPLLVVSIVAFVEGDLLSSISESYHHTFAASVFIGSMCAFAAFLWAYQVKTTTVLGLYENGWGNIGAFLALGVAVFSNAPEASTRPASSPGEGERAVLPPPPADAAQPASPRFETIYEHLDAHAIAGVHLVSAFLFFAVLFVFCLLWAKDDWALAHGTSRVNYLGSAVAIGVGIALAIGTYFLGHGRIASTLFLFAEILMVEGFGYSWLVRGTVKARVAGTMVLAVTVPIVVMLVGFTTYTNAHPGDALEPGMSATAAALGVVGVLGALAALDRHLRPRVGGARRLRARVSE